jgi:hypothetical protein
MYYIAACSSEREETDFRLDRRDSSEAAGHRP